MNQKMVTAADGVLKVSNVMDDLEYFKIADYLEETAKMIYARAGVSLQDIATPGAAPEVQPVTPYNPGAQPSQGLSDEDLDMLEQQDAEQQEELDGIVQDQQDAVDEQQGLVDNMDAKKTRVQQLGKF